MGSSVFGWDAIAIARKYEGIRISLECWYETFYVYFKDGECLDEQGIDSDTSIRQLNRDIWKIHTCFHPKEQHYDVIGPGGKKCRICSEDVEPILKPKFKPTQPGFYNISTSVNNNHKIEQLYFDGDSFLKQKPKPVLWEEKPKKELGMVLQNIKEMIREYEEGE